MRRLAIIAGVGTAVAILLYGAASVFIASMRFDLYRELYTLPAFLDFMPEIAGLRVIDLGCGEGANTRRFARLGGRMTGIDLSAAMIERARAAEAEAPLGIRYEVCSFSDIAIAEAGSFDCALSTLALMDGPDFEGAMRAAARVASCRRGSKEA